MKYQSYMAKMALLTAMLAVILLVAGTATYAWFSSNSVTRTDSVTGRVEEDEVELLISSSGGGSFNGSEEAKISQVNKTKTDQLMPVSTSDLKHFVVSAGTVGNEAVHFEKVENEKYYYHGRVYLQAVAKNKDSRSKLALYLDDSSENGGAFFKNAKGYMMNAARLGLTFDGDSKVIFKVSDESNPKQNRGMNTMLNGVALKDGQVIDSSGNSFKAVSDPAVSLKDYMVGDDGLSGSAKSLFTMELNRIYEVDIYFYMEGCDPDCLDVTQLDKMDFHLAFYGVLTEGASK